MVALGFCFSAMPICCKLFKTADDREQFIRRHLEFFNAHPYFACWCLGATAKLEEEALIKEFIDYPSISKFKERAGSASGSVGDTLFWHFIKPISAGIAVLIAILGSVLAIPIFLIIFNTPHILYRIKGVFLGYKKGFDIISDISMRRYSKVFKWLSRLGAVVAGLVTATGAAWVFHGGAGCISFNGSNLALISFFAAIPLTLLLLRVRLSISTVLLVVMSISIAMTWLLNG